MKLHQSTMQKQGKAILEALEFASNGKFISLLLEVAEIVLLSPGKKTGKMINSSCFYGKITILCPFFSESTPPPLDSAYVGLLFIK